MGPLRWWLAGASVTGAVLLAAPAAAQADAQGCRDGDLARLPGFAINDCDPPAADHYLFAEGVSAQRDVRGTKSRVAYALREGAAVPASTDILNQYAAMFRQQGWTVAASGDQRWIAAHRGGEWAQVETNGGANYQIVYVTGAAGQTAAAAQAYSLACDGVRVGDFATAEGLAETGTVAQYDDVRGGPKTVRKVPGLATSPAVTLSGGTLVDGPAARPERHAPGGDPGTAPGAPRQCQVALRNDSGATIVLWQLHDARLEMIASARGAAAVRLYPEGITTGPGGP